MSGHVVAVAVTDQAPIFELATACEVFGIARADLVDPWYDLRLCAASPIATAGGLTLTPTYDFSDLARADTVIVTAMARPLQISPPAELIAALQAAYARGARIAGICSGAYAMAAAGLLDNRPATTHWMYADEFAARFPAVKLDPDVLYVDDGQVLTSAGTGAGIDLCLHLIEVDHGAAIANMVARRMVVPPHRLGGQAQYVVSSSAAGPIPAPSMSSVLDWARSHLDSSLTVADLAQQAVLSPRTFARRFAEATGTSPLRWLKAERVRLAQQLLETTDEPVERIARRTGFGTAANLRQHFGRATSVSPQAYRRVFRSRPAARA
jgi:transcriptional regulator GlxA family with amidase domain